MTNEEAISVLEDYDINFERHTAEAIAEAHEMAIEALEQQPDEKWNAVLDELNRIGRNAFKDDTDYDNLFDFISNLPNVKPQPKERAETHARDCVSRKGHWITQWNVTHQKEYYYCSECREEFSYDGETGIKMNDYSYCPNCGSCNRGRKE